MKKNGQYVGVDEKYIPEDEKYVDENLLGGTSEIRDGIKSGVNQVKDYVNDPDNQEKMKSTGKKGLKILKGLGIGYIAFIVIILILVIGTFIFSGIFAVKIFKQADKVIDSTTEQIGDIDLESEINQQQVDTFNREFDSYSGTKRTLYIEKLLDEIVTNNKTNKKHIISVVYQEQETSLTNEIISIKHSLVDGEEYEVIMDYDDNGYINKVTIQEI